MSCGALGAGTEEPEIPQRGADGLGSPDGRSGRRRFENNSKVFT